MSRYDDQALGHRDPVFVDERRAPKEKRARVGVVGALSQCLSGDQVDVLAKSGAWYPALVSIMFPDGTGIVKWDKGGNTKGLRADAKVKWRKVRPK